MSPYTLLDPAVRLAYRLVTALAAALPGLGHGAAVAAAILLVTVTVRAGLLPLAVAAARAERDRARLGPELARLRTRHRNDPARLTRETTEAYRRAGVSPVAGCLPMLLQLPVIATLYRLVMVPTVAGQPNALLAAQVLGVPLGAHWPEVLAGAGMVSGPALLLAVLLTGLLVLAWYSGRHAAARTEHLAAAGGSPLPAGQRRLIRLMPYGTALFALVSPAAVGLYLLASTTWTVAERALFTRGA